MFTALPYGHLEGVEGEVGAPRNGDFVYRQPTSYLTEPGWTRWFDDRLADFFG